MYKHLNDLSRNTKKLILICIDIVALPLSIWAGYSLRLGEWWPVNIENGMDQAWWLFFVVPLISIPIFIRMGLYRAVLRYVGSSAFLTILKAITITTLILLAMVVMLHEHSIPRSVFFIFWLISLAFLTGSRLALRSFVRSSVRRRKNKEAVVIYGAGSAGAELARSMQMSWEYDPVAFIDDSTEKQGTEIHGIKVHSPGYLPVLIDKNGITQVLLAMPAVSSRIRQKILEKLEPYQIHIRTLPEISDLVSGKVKVSDIKEVDVADVLGREVVPPVPGLIDQCIRGKNVMVTGAGGSIGSELCRQIVNNNPKQLVLFERSEFALYKIDQELRKYLSKVNIIPVLGSVTDISHLEKVLRKFDIQTVYHAAAYKHVPLVEENPVEGFINNAFGTWHAAEVAKMTGVETFVLISTDKAVRPTNVMGATKRLAELILQAMADEKGETKFTMVRFGNVLDSSGSVIPLFRQQIQTGGPVTVTHPDVTRYFMTIPEAAQLVLQAGSLADGGDVFVLDMGDPIKIIDLATHMIHLSGLEICDDENPDGDIEIQYIGLRPGEKLYEELLIGVDVTGTAHPKIMRAAEEKLPYEKIMHYMNSCQIACKNYDEDKIKTILGEIVSGYSPDQKIEKEKNTDLYKNDLKIKKNIETKNNLH